MPFKYCLKKIEVQTVVLSFLIRSAYALQITAKNSRDGSETFLKCKTTVTLECTHQSYTGQQSWKYDSTEVASCILTNCQDISSNNGFGFKFDTTNGKFQWTINPVKDEYKNKRFECFNGSHSVDVTAKFDGIGLDCYGFAIIIAVIIFINIVAVIVTIVYRWINGKDIVKVKPKRNPAENESMNTQGSETRGTGDDGRNNTGGLKEYSTWLRVFKRFWIALLIFLVGIILTVILILVTRFSEGSVVEVYEDICGWEILLILFGIDMFVALGLLVALIIIMIVIRR